MIGQPGRRTARWQRATHRPAAGAPPAARPPPPPPRAAPPGGGPTPPPPPPPPPPPLRGDEEDLYRRHHRELRHAVARAVHAPPELIEDACQSAWAILLS